MRIAASLASAPLDRLGDTVRQLESAGVDCLHFDVEDGSFVPCMNLGTKIIAELRPLTRVPFDVHLMMVQPEWLLPVLAGMGADRVSVHYEACLYPRRVLRQICELGMAAGLAINPVTPVPELRYLAPYLSFVVILTTEPEMPDAPHLAEVVGKVRAAKAATAPNPLECVVDGGIGVGNLPQAAGAGADTVVVGRGIFNSQSIEQNIRALRVAAS